MNILEELWYGNIAPYETPIVKGSEYEQASNLAIRHDTALTDTLTQQQKEMFQKFKDAHLDMLSLGERDAFVRGFTLGVKLIVAVMDYEK